MRIQDDVKLKRLKERLHQEYLTKSILFVSSSRITEACLSTKFTVQPNSLLDNTKKMTKVDKEVLNS